MRTKEVIRAALISLEEDDRLKSPPATITENAPLALIQLELEAKISALRWVLNQKGRK